MADLKKVYAAPDEQATLANLATCFKYMRTFYEEWAYLDRAETPLIESEPGNLAPAGAKLESINWHQLVPKQIGDFPDASFSQLVFRITERFCQR